MSTSTIVASVQAPRKTSLTPKKFRGRVCAKILNKGMLGKCLKRNFIFKTENKKFRQAEKIDLLYCLTIVNYITLYYNLILYYIKLYYITLYYIILS